MSSVFIEIAETKRLVQALALAAATAPKKSVRPILTGALLQASASGFTITATDEAHSSRQCLQPTDQSGQIVICAKDLHDVAKSLAQMAPVTLSWDEEALICKLEQGGGRTAFELQGFNAEDFPDVPSLSKEAHAILPLGKLVDALQGVVSATSADEARYYLGGVFFRYDKKEDTLFLEATDGHRLAVRRVTFEGEEHTAAREALARFFGKGQIVSRTLLDNFLKAAGKAEDGDAFGVGVLDKHIAFSFGDREVTGRFIEGSFPDVRQVVPSQTSVRAVVSVGEAITELKRVALVNPTTKMFRLSVYEGQSRMYFSAECGGKKGKGDIFASATGGDIEIGFCAQLLLDALAPFDAQKSAHVALRFTNYLAPVMIRAAVKGEDGSWQEDESLFHVVMPARL